MKFLILFFMLTGILAAKESKPVLLLGAEYDTARMESAVLIPAGILYEKSSKWIRPESYFKYSAVYYGQTNKNQKEARWEKAEEIAALKKYVENGGTLILGGNALYHLCGKGRSLAALSDIIGFEYYNTLDVKKYNEVTFTDIGAEWVKKTGFDKKSWNWLNLNGPGKITTAKIVAEYTGKNVPARPAILLNLPGKGKVYTVAPTLFEQARHAGNLGEPDEKGNFILNEDGRRIRGLTQLYTAIFLSTENLARRRSPDIENWEVVPLGSPGSLDLNGGHENQPVFHKKSHPKDLFLLAENGMAKALIVHGGQILLAKELKRHLDKITGADFKIASTASNETPAIIFRNDDSLPPETVVAKTEKNRVILSGPGIRMAMFYFLEKLGCRYLWPGKDGKIIPEKKTLYAPEMNLKESPRLLVRGIRNPNPDGQRNSWGMKICGIVDSNDQKNFSVIYRKTADDMPENSSLWQWHGMGARERFQWGHAFGYFWKKYGKEQEDYFALQPNGLRSQMNSPERPRLCKGNRETSDAAANDILEYFRRNPGVSSQSICLNDGGMTSFCMCVKCRKLDPVNAPPQSMYFSVDGIMQRINYVSLTDRMLDFSNRIAEKVTDQFPGKLLSIYLYSAYAALPVKVTPHKSLIFCLTEQSYINDLHRKKCLNDYRKWSSFGNKIFFRPNALWGHYEILAPQNYARKMFQDLEYYKANGLLGTDFDCCEQQWAGKGLIYYVLLKAHWNPDRWSYDDILDDYCSAGFGPAAAEIKEYWNLLERLTDRAAAGRKPYLEFFNEKTAAELRAILNRATEKAKNDTSVLRRIEFLRLGLTAGDYTILLQKALDAKDRTAYADTLANFRNWIRKTAFSSPFALQPGVLYRNIHLTKDGI